SADAAIAGRWWPTLDTGTGARASSTHAAAASETTYWATLKTIFSGAVRFARSATPTAIAYTAIAGPAPNESSNANANAVEIVTRPAVPRRGTSMGSSSPSATN